MLERLREAIGLSGIFQIFLVVVLGGAAVVGLSVHPSLWEPKLVFTTTRVAARAAMMFLGLGIALPVVAAVIDRLTWVEHRVWICGAFRVLGIGCLLFAAVSSWP